MEKEVKVYSTPTCPYCKMAKDYLAANNVKYTEVDVAKDPAAREEMVKASGQMGVPVIAIDGEVIVGFNKTKLKETLGL